MGVLIPAVKSRWVSATKLEGGSQKTNSAAPANNLSEVRRKKGRDYAVAEIKKAQHLGVPWRTY
jgi:hypothetical protein